ncbi:MAG: alkane 1-monooxygenase, partial [Flavobacteriales bacterium]
MSDLKYLFAYTIPMATLLSLLSSGMFTYSAPIYAFIIIPLLELLLKDFNTHYSDAQKEKRLNNLLFDLLLYLNIPFVFGILGYGFYILNNKVLLNYETIGIILSLGILLA